MEHHERAGMTDRRQNTRHAAGTGNHHSRPNFRPRSRRNLMQENAALRAQLQETQLQEQQSKAVLKQAHKRASRYESQRDEFHSKFFHFRLEAEKTISDLKCQLQQGLSNETRTYLKVIHELKFELSEAHTERINSANRLMLADRIIESLTSKLDDANKKLQQQNSNPAPIQATKTLRALLAELKTATDTPSEYQCWGEQHKFTDQLWEQLQIATDELETQAAKHMDENEALCSQIKQLKDEICVSKALTEINEEKRINLEKELNDTKAFHAALLEEQKKENANIAQALQKAEEEKASLQHTLMEREDKETRLEEATSKINVSDEESEDEIGCWPFRLFS